MITNAPPVDFSKGIDLDRLFVSTKRLAGAELIDGKSCVMDANEKYSNVKSGDFALPRSSLLTKPIEKYDAIALTIGASAAGAVSTALKERDDVLVIDALREANVNQVLFDIRQNHSLPIAVFTSNKELDEFLKTNSDAKLVSNLSVSGKGWGEHGIDAIKENRFDGFADAVESRVDHAIALAKTQPTAPKPSIRASLNIDPLAASNDQTTQTKPNHHRHQMGL